MIISSSGLSCDISSGHVLSANSVVLGVNPCFVSLTKAIFSSELTGRAFGKFYFNV